MNSHLTELISHVVARARAAGLDARDQRDAAVAVLMAAMPDEPSAIAHFLVDLAYPRLVVDDAA